MWNVAILRGNMMLLATLSYFTPVISTLLSSVILGVALGASFLQGVVMVTLGSLLCWWVTRSKSADSDSLTEDSAVSEQCSERQVRIVRLYRVREGYV